MMEPAIPKPTAEYMAAKRAECKPKPPCDGCDKKGKETLREQAPFWMIQAALAYDVPDSVDTNNLSSSIQPAGQHYNGVVFDKSLDNVNGMNGGTKPEQAGIDKVGNYLAMGSFFQPLTGPDDMKNEPGGGSLMGRYFLVEVTDPKGFTIKNPNSCYPGEKDSPCADCVDKDGTCFAPCGSYILAFSGTEGLNALNEVKEDGLFGFPNTCMLNTNKDDPAAPKYETYQRMLLAHNRMFDGTDDKCAAEANQMMGVTTALETPVSDTSNPRLPYGGAGFVEGGSFDKQITIVGHSLGGAQAQLAAVQIATKYQAKVRVITFESILAFTPEGADNVVHGIAKDGVVKVDGLIVGPDGVVSDKAEPTVKFPPEAGKITAQRWVEDDSPLTIAPLLAGAGACCPFPFLNPLDFCRASYWQNKPRLVGCWPFNQNLGKGYISRALVLSGYQAGLFHGPPSWGMFGFCPKSGGRLCRGCPGHKDTLQYPDWSFALDISPERSYVSKAAGRAWLIGNFFCEAVRGGTNHKQYFLLWMLYKGAFQNKTRTNGNTVSQYVPKVTP